MSICVPFTFIVGDLIAASGAPPWAKQEIPNLSALVTSYTHAIADRYGFESATLQYTGDADMAVAALNLLGRSLTVVGPYGRVCWEGMFHRIGVSASGQDHSISLENVANTVKVRFTAPFGSSAVSSTYSDTASQARYGVKHLVQTGGADTLAAANSLAQRILNERKDPLPDTAVQLQTGAADKVGWLMTLDCVGLYEELGWCVTSNTTTSTAATTTQVATLLASDPNAWIVAGDIVASGISDTQFIAEDTTRRAKIETLLGQGDSSNQPLSWGVYENRAFSVIPWAGTGTVPLAPGPLPLYRTNQNEMTIRNADGGIVDWWDVRPNYRYTLSTLLDVAVLNGTGNTTNAGVAGRVSFSCSQDAMSLSLEGVYQSSADAIIARLR